MLTIAFVPSILYVVTPDTPVASKVRATASAAFNITVSMPVIDLYQCSYCKTSKVAPMESVIVSAPPPAISSVGKSVVLAVSVAVTPEKL